MYYLIQENVFKDPRYDQIFKAMKQLHLPYERFSFVKKFKEITVNTQRKDIFVYGSVQLAKVCKDREWSPGSLYGGIHEFQAYKEAFGTHVLNHSSKITTIENGMDWNEGEALFIKPTKEAKMFTGKVFSRKEWEEFLYQKSAMGYESLFNPIEVMYCTPSHLIKEARIWIVGGEVITSSYYRFHGNQEFEESVEEQGIQFAQEMASRYQKQGTYVMDIVKTWNGWKIMELNCINSAGFYQANVVKLIQALENHYMK